MSSIYPIPLYKLTKYLKEAIISSLVNEGPFFIFIFSLHFFILSIKASDNLSPVLQITSPVFGLIISLATIAFKIPSLIFSSAFTIILLLLGLTTSSATILPNIRFSKFNFLFILYLPTFAKSYLLGSKSNL